MKFLIFSALSILFLSCKSEKSVQIDRDNQILITTFRPAFDEASEITFENESVSSQLSILIRKNFRLDENEDTFYYKTVALDEKQIAVLQNAIVSRLDSSIIQQNNTIRDGIGITCQYIQNGKTTFYSLNNPSHGSKGYELITTSLDTYQHIFGDTIISDYFNDLRTYITHKGFIQPKVMTPLKLMREKKYVGLMKYNR